MFNLHSNPKCSSVTSIEPRTQFDQGINITAHFFGNTFLSNYSFYEALPPFLTKMVILPLTFLLPRISTSPLPVQCVAYPSVDFLFLPSRYDN